MRIKTLVEEDFTNYKLPSMFIGTASCNGKCCTEAGIPISVCQNDGWRACGVMTVSDDTLVDRYMGNVFSQSIVFGGLEPFEQFEELVALISKFREQTLDDIVIYTGYNKEEITEQVEKLKQFPNIVIKFGRFVPDSTKRYDDVLGVTLVSDNQYAERIS